VKHKEQYRKSLSRDRPRQWNRGNST